MRKIVSQGSKIEKIYKSKKDAIELFNSRDEKYKIDRKEYIKIIKKIGRDNNIRHLKGFKMLQKRIF